MKKTLVILALAALLLIAARPLQEVQPVELPQELKDLLEFALVFAVTGALKWASGKLGKDLSGWSAMIAAGLMSAILGVITAMLSAVPLDYADIANAVLRMIVVALGAMGVYGIKRQSVKSQDARRLTAHNEIE